MMVTIDISIARTYNLSTQLEHINLQRPNVYIADLRSETVQDLEARQRAQVIQRFLGSIFRGGRTEENLTLKKFFLSDAVLTSILRLLCWLGPVPEVGTLLVDWSRAQAGGVPEVVFPIFECVLRGRFPEAKKIAFAQELVSGLADSGDWGGGALSNINVRVDARNRECCRIINQLIRQSSSESLRIAVLYGAFHRDDMIAKFREIGLTPASSSLMTAWTVNLPPSPLSTPSNLLRSFSGRVLAVAIVVAVYLFLGAVDWYFLISLSVRSLDSILHSFANSRREEVSDLLFEFIYLVFYVQRHSLLYNRASNVGVQWQQGLFDGIYTTKAD